MPAEKEVKELHSGAPSATDTPPSELSLEDYPPSTGATYGSVEPHVFTHPARAEYWRNTYEKAKYECRHRFDPSFQWSHQGEVLVKRKVISHSLPLHAPAKKNATML